ncbi:MAG TPA: hypothetical protein VE617_06105 [Propionibacteriaceae bacterium]|nr:hypothetical protein [Propionibacteriaceae bacterium]
MAEGDAEGVLLTGAYGTGKSSLAEEMAHVLELRGVAFGALDLDWLGWFGAPGLGEGQSRDVFLRNLAAVTANYRAAGVLRFVLAGSVRDRDQVIELEAAAGVPLRVIRLVVGEAEITRRLLDNPTSGRRVDLDVARQWLADGIGEGIEDRALANEGPVAVAAATVLDWLGWGSPRT